MSGEAFALPASRGHVLRLFLADLVGLGAWTLLRFARDVRPTTRRDCFGMGVLWGGAVALAWALGGLWVLTIWGAALGSSYWAFFRLRVWTEHQGTAGTQRISVRWWQRWFIPLNMWFHYEHHRWPGVPYWKLPRARLLDDATPVVPVEQLFRGFETSPRIPAGQPLQP